MAVARKHPVIQTAYVVYRILFHTSNETIGQLIIMLGGGGGGGGGSGGLET